MDDTEVDSFQDSGLIKPRRKLKAFDYVKYCLFIDSVLILLLGCCCLGLGLWIQFGELFQFDTASFSYIYVVGYSLIAISICVVVTAAVGCCSVIKINKPIAACFLTSLLVEFFLLLTTGCWSIIQAVSMEEVALVTLRSSVATYFSRNSSSSFMMIVQTKFGCCGVDHGFSDYATYASSDHGIAPSVELANNLQLYSSDSTVCDMDKFASPCLVPVTEYMHWRFVLLSSIIIQLLFTMLIALVLILLACCGRIKQEEE